MLSWLAKDSFFFHWKAVKRVRSLSLRKLVVAHLHVIYRVERISSSWKTTVVRWRSAEQPKRQSSDFSSETDAIEYVRHESGWQQMFWVEAFVQVWSDRSWAKLTTTVATRLPMNLPLSRRQTGRCHWYEDTFDGWTQHSVRMEMLISHRMKWEPILHSFSFLTDRCSTSVSVYEIFSSCVATVPWSIKSQWPNLQVLQNPWPSFQAKCFCGPDKHIRSLDVKNVFFNTEHSLTVEEAIQTILFSRSSSTVLKLSCRRVNRENQRCSKSWGVEYNFPLGHTCDIC